MFFKSFQGSFVIKVTAEDKDKTNKGEIVYGLVQGKTSKYRTWIILNIVLIQCFAS